MRSLAPEFPVALLCRVVALAPSTYYYEPCQPDDLELRAQIEEIALEFPRYCYRRMAAELKRRQFLVNHKRVLRLMREGCLLVHIRQYCRSTTNSHHGYGRYPNLIKRLSIVRPDQVWCADLTYIRLEREFIAPFGRVGCLFASDPRLGAGSPPDRGTLEGRPGTSLGEPPTGDSSQRPGSAVCCDWLHSAAGSGPRPDQHGSRGPAD